MEDKTSLGQSAEDFYSAQTSRRTAPVQVARRLADLTIPTVFTDEAWSSGDDIKTLNQSINARAVNSLANKLTDVALPVSLPPAKFSPIETAMQEDIQNDPELWANVEYALARRMDNHKERLKTTSARSAYGQSMKLAIVTGNWCVRWTDLDEPIVYNMNQYVVKRSYGGSQLVKVAKDRASYAEADEDVQNALDANRTKADLPSSKWDDEFDLYHVEVLEKDPDTGDMHWHYWQEIEGGHVVEDTDAYSPLDKPAMYAGGLIREPGSSWYLPYCLDYEGDLSAVETLGASIQDGAAAMAWFLFMVNPTGQTDIQDVQKAENLDVIPGRADDVGVVNTQKGGEMATVSKEFAEAARRIGFAFAMQTAIQRPQERVTAEEWRTMAHELDQVMGNVYTELSQGFQSWFINRGIYLHELEDDNMQPLPEGMVRVSVITGLDAMGQSTDLTNFRAFALDATNMFGPEVLAQELNRENALRLLAAMHSVKTDGLTKSAEEKQQEQAQQQQRAQQQTLLEQATGPLAKEGAAAIREMMTNGNTQGEPTNG